METKISLVSKQSIRTKAHLKKAFISLINEKGYSHVTVKDIVNRAMYNRTTFYLHYLDKNHLTEELQEEMFNAIKRTSMDRYRRGENIPITNMGPESFELFHFIYKTQDFFNLYLKKDTIPGLHQDLPKAIYEILEEHFIFTADNSDTINSSEHKLYMAYGTAGLITEWIRKRYITSPNEMSLQLINILKTFADGFTIVTK
ncbi:TetR/AcrR family transcriptional regulator [Pseudalkalibacillus caeni]|uniref:TetR/AcrR family transcriptional regulator n=1 Tax=Exobacillus caeni TaxID=2574798 RepID=A0A5R9F2R8_9BACL|nr:TetR/AcrR family transcriptional regulator [Pseudalkalibacillus caeni]TLS36789.1 TetR/AcrR family transcriptional regulator [Pseudalkalibacillus caeni]